MWTKLLPEVGGCNLMFLWRLLEVAKIFAGD